MTMREQVIVSISVVVLALGGGMYGVDWVMRFTSFGDSASKGKAEAEAFVAQAQQRLSTVAVTEAEQAVLSAAREPWDGQPFVDAPVVEEKEVSTSVDSTFIYSGFIEAGGRRFAIINGKEYAVHDVLADRAGVVQAIEPDHVVLRVGLDGQRQVIPLIRQLQPGERK